MKIRLKESNIQKILFGVLKTKKNKAKQIFFYDYDGDVLHTYTNIENLTSLPSLPDRTSENLTCDGWNWTLADIKSQINNVGGIINIGAIYHTTDDKTHITCKPMEIYPTASIQLRPTVANAVIVDWGDGTTDTWTGTISELKTHTYTGVADSSVYDITISCSSGTYSFNTYIAGTEENNRTSLYTDIKLSNKVTSLGTNCFCGCSSLQIISLPNEITSLGDNCFQYCYSLQSITIPNNSLTSLPFNFCNQCCSLRSISIPPNITQIGIQCFSGCYILQTITIPNGVTSLQCFGTCVHLQSITIPNGVTSFGSSCFDGCTSLQSITIPNGVTSFGSSSFSRCYFLQTMYMKPTTPPTLSSSSSIPSDTSLVIYVPRGSLSAYQSASNWSSFSSKMVEYDY